MSEPLESTARGVSERSETSGDPGDPGGESGRRRGKNARRARPYRRFAMAALLALLGAPALFVAWRSYRVEREMCFPKPTLAGSPADVGLADAREVSFESNGERLYGWYLPARNGGAIALFHGAGGNRASLAAEARALHEGGFGVLLLELPGHGRSEGDVRWGRPEETAIRDAVQFLLRQPGVDAERLGALGFSLGGYMLARVARSDVRIRAVALEGTPAHLGDRIRHTHRRWGTFGAACAKLAFLQSGHDPERDSAHAAVPEIAPRALLIVTSEQDELVPRAMAETMFAAARQPKALLVVPGNGHGGYASRSRSYAADLVEFFRQGLGLTPWERTQ
ncbi:MAG TPA: alpha/beta fold hydrolase [Polyangiaceae bacterium]|nr:alpha/beta fold hydrolase [Polyangiaceae bacterium]